MANPLGLSDRAWWFGQFDRTPEKRFTGTRSSSCHVKTRDGTRVAIDVYLPDTPTPEPLPTILSVTPYFRALEFRSPLYARLVKKLAVVGSAEFAEQITPYGYAHVVMELRGAGASFGSRRSRTMPDAVRDGRDVIDWIVAQPWSNGRVGATGISAVGMTAEWLTTAQHPALRAIAPRFTTFDVFASTHPGGIVASRFMVDVGALLRAMDANRPYDMPENALGRFLMRLMVKGIRRVDDDDDGRLMAEAVLEHEKNVHPEKDLLAINYRDDPLPQSGGTATVDTDSPHTHAAAMKASGAAIYGFAAWHDGAFIREMLALYNTVSNPGSRIVIGPWPHGGRWYSSPVVARRRATDFDHVAEMVRFFDLHLRDRDHGLAAEDPVHYFTMGEECWKSAPAWPPPLARPVNFYLGPGGILQTAPPDADGADRYAVDLDAGTGVHSRFGKHLAGGRFPVRYPDRAKRDRKLLVYTSAPLVENTEVTGHPSVSLHLRSTQTDGAILAYLEDVAPDGVVRCVTDGALRLTARSAREGSWPYWALDPYRPFLRGDAREVVPGETMELRFDLFPISWLFSAGHSIRLAFAGADRDNFLPIPTEKPPEIQLLYGPSAPSLVQLPVMPRA